MRHPLAHMRLLTPALVLPAVEGAECKNVKIDGGDLSKAERTLAADRGATAETVKRERLKGG